MAKLPPAKPLKPKTKAPAPLPYAGYLSPQQMAAIAAKNAQLVIGPEALSIKQQKASEAATERQREQTIQGLYLAAAKMLQGTAPQIQGIYQGAANSQATFGKGYSDGLQLAQQGAADQTNATLTNLGAPAGQLEHPTTGAADATYAMGGAIPANSLNMQGAGFASAAAFLPATTVGRGQQQLAQTLFKSQETQKQFDQALQALEAKRPGIIQDLLTQLGSQQGSLQSLDYQRQAAGLSQQNKMGYNAKGGLLPGYATGPDGNVWKISDINAYNRVLKTSGAGAASSKANLSWSRALGYIVDGNLNPILGANGKPVRMPNMKTPKPKFSATATQKYKGMSELGASNAANGYTDANNKFVPPTDYTDAIQQALQNGVPLEIFIPILNKYYKPGQNGRPYLPPSAAQVKASKRYKGKH